MAVFESDTLVSLWDMIRFYAHYFYGCLGRLRDPAISISRRTMARGKDQQLKPDEAQEVSAVLDELSKQCKLLELEKADALIRHLVPEVNGFETLDPHV